MAYVNVDNILDTLAVELIRDKSNKRALESRERIARNQLAQQESQFDRSLKQGASQYDRSLGQRESEFARTLAQNEEQFKVTSAPTIRAMKEKETGDELLRAKLSNAQREQTHLNIMMKNPKYRNAVREKLLKGNLSFLDRYGLTYGTERGENVIDAYGRTTGLPERTVPDYTKLYYNPETMGYAKENLLQDIVRENPEGSIDYLLQLIERPGGN